MRIGDRVMVIGDHAYPSEMRGYAGNIRARLGNAMLVQFEWLVKQIWYPRAGLSPVYRQCSVCDYDAFRARNEGTDKDPRWVHYCDWCS